MNDYQCNKHGNDQRDGCQSGPVSNKNKERAKEFGKGG